MHFRWYVHRRYIRQRPTSENKLGSMEHLEHPMAEQWEIRRRWFESHIFHYEELGSCLVGEQASALLSEVES
jgi:hypothetical protein